MRVLHLSHSDMAGGAARAAFRLHSSLVQARVESRLKVRRKTSDVWTVDAPRTRGGRAWGVLRPALGTLVMDLQRPAGRTLHSGNLLPSAWARNVNFSNADVVNLHWVAGETLSIEDIGRINKPLVWTLHDMWAFCGGEHYASDDEAARWRVGYTKRTRNPLDGGPDLDRLIWLRKRRSWLRPIVFVAPSSWLATCLKESALFHQCPVSVIPNVLDTTIYRPFDRDLCREVLGIPKDQKVVLFGAIGGNRDPRKGWDLLTDALRTLSGLELSYDLQCMVVGQSAPENYPNTPYPTRWMGHLHDDWSLVLAYNAADVVVVPSRQENLPQSATEAHACGTPVIAFRATGLADVVEHGVTGYLAQPYSSMDLAEGIRWVLEDNVRHRALSTAARERAVRLWSPGAVIPLYLDAYRRAIESQGT